MRWISDDKTGTPSYNPGLWPAMGWSSEFWAGLLDKVDVPVVALDAEGNVLLANFDAARLLALGGTLGRRLPSRLEGLRKDPGAGLRRVAVETAEGPWIFNVRALSVEGHPRTIVAAGERPGAVPELVEAGGEAAAMAGQMGQRVKGPLAGIELYASILDEELSARDDGDLTGIVGEIRQGVRDLNEYLTSFESMTRTLELRLERLRLADVVDEALETLGGLLKSSGVGLLVDQGQVEVLGDRRLLVQLFLNVILNAIEAMPDGGRLMVDIRDDERGQAEVVVTDTGPGVDPRRAREIFNPFFSSKDQPLGLGLPVSRRVAEAHRGRILVGSDTAGGARVSVTLPSLEAAAAEMVEAAEGLKSWN